MRKQVDVEVRITALERQIESLRGRIIALEGSFAEMCVSFHRGQRVAAGADVKDVAVYNDAHRGFVD